MVGLDSSVVARLEREYPRGTRVELVSMNDRMAPPVGTLGTVFCVDSMGTIHVNWDNGSMLGVAYGEDTCRVVKEK